MKDIRVSIQIQQPVDHVIDIAWDPQKTHLWIPEPSLTVGSALPAPWIRRAVSGPFGVRLVFDQKVEETVSRRRVEEEIREVHGWFSSKGVWDYEPVSGGTRVSVRHEVQLKGWVRLLDPLIFWQAQKKVAGDLVRLKKILVERTAQES